MIMEMTKKLCSLALAVLFIASLCGSCSAAEKVAFKTVDLDGAEISETVLNEAALTVLNVWGTYCPPCLREMPSLGKLSAELKPEGVQIIGALYDWFDRSGQLSFEQISKARTLVQRTSANYRHILLDDELIKIIGDFNAIPYTVFIDKNGNIVEKTVGSLSEDQWRTKIKAALACVQS